MAFIDEFMCSSRFSLVFIHKAHGFLYGFSYNNTTHSQNKSVTVHQRTVVISGF